MNDFIKIIIIILFLNSTVPTILFSDDSATQHILIEAGAEYGYPPYSIDDGMGNATGFSVELLDAALHVMNRETSFKLSSWNEVKQDLENGTVQVLPLVARSPEREDDFDFTFPYLTMHGTIVVRNDTPMPDAYEELENKLVGVMESDAAEEFVKREKIQVNIVSTETFEQALKLLSDGAIDAVVIQRYLAFQLIEQLSLENLKIGDLILENFKQDFCFAVKEGDNALLQLLNEGLSIVIANGTFDRLQSKWFSPDGTLKTRFDRLIVGGDEAYPPYEYIDENGDPAGYNVDLTRAIAKQMGLNIEIQLGPWNEIYKGLLSGDIDIIQGLFYSTDRDMTISFSQPHTVINHVAVSRIGSPSISDSDDLKGLDILVMKGDIMYEFAIHLGYEEQIILAESQEEAIKRLSAGEADCALVAQIPAYYWIDKYNITNLQIYEKSIKTFEYNYGVSQKNDRLLLPFTEGLATLKSSGEYRDIYSKWLGVYEEKQGHTTEQLIKILLFAGLPLLLIFLSVMVWYRSLRKQVALRTMELHKMTIKLQNKVLQLEKTETTLATSEENLHTILNSIGDAVIATDINGRIIRMNPVAEKITGWLTDDARNLLLNDVVQIVHTHTKAPMVDLIKQVLENGKIISQADYDLLLEKDGREYHITYSMAPIRSTAGIITGIVMVLQDVTEKIQLEEQFHQIRKVESIGSMAGGIAHDLNNILTPILGFSELLLKDFKSDDSRIGHVEQILNAGYMGRDLVSQLLTFSRKQALRFAPMNLNKIVKDFELLLRRTIREDILIDIIYSPETCVISGDKVQIEQVIMNLSVNAQDAMPQGGRLTLAINKINLSEYDTQNHERLEPGEYINLSIRDTGAGMDGITIKHIFEPFFSTKGNLGTGLGLSTVYGIIKQHKGHIIVNSESGKGTSFNIYLSIVMEDIIEEKKQSNINIDLKGNETILLVEDNEQVCQFAQALLELYGYNVLAVENGLKALQILTLQKETIHLLLTDVIMPEMNGRDLFTKASEIDSDLKVLYMSGYTNDIFNNQGIGEKDFHFIQKPFSHKDLASKVRAVLRDT